MWIAVLALGALLVAGGGVAWYLSSNSVQEEAFIASDDQEDAPRQAEPQQPDESIQQQAALDSAAEPVVDTTLTMPEATKHTTAETLTKQATPIRQPKQPPTPEPRKQPVPDISQSAVQSEQTAPHVERLNVEPETKTNTDLKVTKSKPSASEPAWVVQVFASPSRDDAEEWLQQLREQRIPDGYIVEQKVKGQSWYRVRFGQFPSRAEAEQAAQTRGFAQPWIARVR